MKTVRMQVSRELLNEMFALGTNREIVDAIIDLENDQVTFTLFDKEAPQDSRYFEPSIVKNADGTVRLEAHYR